MLMPQPASAPIRRILDGALDGAEVSVADAEALFRAGGADRDAVVAVADQLRRQAVGDDVTFVVNRNIHFTNVCYMGCRFCGFAKRMEDDGAQWLSLDAIVARAQECWDRGGTEVCIQGGLHPKMDGGHYLAIIEALKTALPDLHIHAFSPFEIWYGVKKTGTPLRTFLTDLKAAGLGSMPGTAAEILDTEIRQVLTRDKLTADAWEEIITTAHEVGIPTTATIMYGHVDGPSHWAAHIGRLRDIQRRNRDRFGPNPAIGSDVSNGGHRAGFTEFVPLSFVHEDAPLYRDDPTAVRPGPTGDEAMLMHAVSRIMLHGWIDNIQVSWTKLGPEMAQAMLRCGVNDLGGTLMNESISRAAGAKNGQEVTAFEMAQIIRAAGRTPVRRNTLYQPLERYENHDPSALNPLVDRAGRDPLAFLAEEKRQTA